VDDADHLRQLSRFPIVVAPMAGGPSTVELVLAAADAGVLGTLAGGYKSAQAMHDEIAAVKARRIAFGVNVFVPGQPTNDPAGLGRYIETLQHEADGLGTTLGSPGWDDDAYEAKLEVLIAEAPPMVTFTFGCPDHDVIRALQAKGSVVGITVTTVDEAVMAASTGVDCLCVQGSEAGAHRGSFVNDDCADQDVPLRQLLLAILSITDVPLIAAGGIGRADEVCSVLDSGAALVQMGTAFLRSTESGANPAYKAALADHSFTETAVTRAFSGRRARSLVNQMMRDHVDAPKAYPEINNATRPLRAIAAQQGDTNHMSLYAGEGFRRSEARPLGEIVAQLRAGLTT
jgi:nitronate monooxygenase